MHNLHNLSEMPKQWLSTGLFLLLMLGFSQGAYAQCGGASEPCCDNTLPPSAGETACLSGTLPATCVCDSGLFCVIGPANPLVSTCSKCSDAGDSCCWNWSADSYVCQGDTIHCDQESNKCVANSSLPTCSNVGDSCCVAFGSTRYCETNIIPNLECNSATGFCYIPDQTCGTAPLKCCLDPVDPVLNPGTCLGTDVCDATKADAASSKGYCIAQGTCGGLDEICCTTGDQCNDPSWKCTLGFCRNDVPDDFGDSSYFGFKTYTGPIITDLAGLLAPIFKILFYTGVFVGILGIIYSGYLLIASEGDPGRVKEGKDQFTAAILGTLFVLLSVFILRVIINNILGVNSGL
ncbi:MAG: hypothetical protein UV00_C0007G0020 [candidate division WWE3 bacterium GW2011_GWF1_42_14]|uniref:Uncharacterized protein n=2 Tax=Katanobacteria TaxID=422282 RepID=A0A0G0YP98_UNCKA|nr:MAG: hypothetical protein UU97_C0008G0008 [candidate division WWE3 bacterium GW2011_GWD1_42_14]KKS38439.1 MAG: hypothetical protein UV00_C0007G0020 [candidate division WWE3 bacterium GW2011_GWF1_42_14]KKS40483.1 MAG: hypothetical protein UV03_C0006G0015 [candidate division WWE3 bacterium GW2011_GWE1_42_16]KKS66527.1 MAG: hypothetical protein UV35_C0012G0003 [candidate division WWE3 bacterium GW2011_GWB1_42_6]